jgi:hypothetical protein
MASAIADPSSWPPKLTPTAMPSGKLCSGMSRMSAAAHRRSVSRASSSRPCSPRQKITLNSKPNHLATGRLWNFGAIQLRPFKGRPRARLIPRTWRRTPCRQATRSVPRMAMTSLWLAQSGFSEESCWFLDSRCRQRWTTPQQFGRAVQAT